VFFEELGLLLRKDHLDKDFVWDGFLPYAVVYWEYAVEPLTLRPGARRTLYWCYKELVQDMDKLTKKKDEKLRLNDDELRQFLTVERNQWTGVQPLSESAVARGVMSDSLGLAAGR
jgi:hypothetical protein